MADNTLEFKAGANVTLDANDEDNSITVTVYAKSAYDLAVEGGYTGTESEFFDIMGNIGRIPVALNNILGNIS